MAGELRCARLDLNTSEHSSRTIGDYVELEE
jgi:hypothetical protein